MLTFHRSHRSLPFKMSARQRLQARLQARLTPCHTLDRDTSHTAESVKRHAKASGLAVLDITQALATCPNGSSCPCGTPESKLNQLIVYARRSRRSELKAWFLADIPLTVDSRRGRFDLYVIREELFAVDKNDPSFVARMPLSCLMDEQEREEKAQEEKTARGREEKA